jgi:hypothetical protein
MTTLLKLELALTLENLLTRAEGLFGPRDTSFTTTGVDFHEDGPFTACALASRKEVGVFLNYEAKDDPSMALFQLGRQAVHLLSPSGRSDLATVLEEGLAVWHGSNCVREVYGVDVETEDPRHQRAAVLAWALLDRDPASVRRLREHEPALWKIDAELILHVYPSTGGDLARELSLPFAAWDPGESRT